MPISIDKEVGQKIRKDFIKHAPIDYEKTRLLNDFYKKLDFNNETELYVVKAKDFNAISLPDNSIIVFDGVFKDIKTYPELAALLAHEYVHIKNRHGMKSLAHALSYELLAEIFTNSNESEGFIRNANKLLQLKNSRGFETQADIEGLELLKKQHIDQNGMADLFKDMLALPQESNQEEVSSYLSTHPKTEERLNKVNEEIEKHPENSANDNELEQIFNELVKDN